MPDPCFSKRYITGGLIDGRHVGAMSYVDRMALVRIFKNKKFCILKKGLKKRGEGHVNSACARAVWVHFLPDIAHTQQYLCAIACCFWICADPTFPSLFLFFFFFSFFSCKNTYPLARFCLFLIGYLGSQRSTWYS